MNQHSPLWLVLIGASIYAGGVVGAMTVGNELIMGAVPPDSAGAAAAVVETSSEFGGALGMAVLGSIGVAVYRSELAARAPAHVPAVALGTARSTLGGALSIAAELPGRIGADLVTTARVAFIHALNVAALGAAFTMIVAAAVSARYFRAPTSCLTASLPAIGLSRSRSSFVSSGWARAVELTHPALAPGLRRPRRPR